MCLQFGCKLIKENEMKRSVLDNLEKAIDSITIRIQNGTCSANEYCILSSLIDAVNNIQHVEDDIDSKKSDYYVTLKTKLDTSELIDQLKNIT